MILLKLTLRNIRKNRLFFFVNILGLMLGSSILFLILNYAFYEYSYDDFHKSRKDIYRVITDQYNGNELQFEYAITYPVVGPTLLEEFSEVSDYVRLYTESIYGPVIFTYEEPDGEIVKSLEPKTYYVDPSFFEFFDFKLTHGNPGLVLNELNSVVISERAAEKFFKGEDAIGKTLTVYDRGGTKDLVVTGVVENPPLNSHMQFDFLISYQSLGSGEWCTTSWNFLDFTTYIKLNPGANRTITAQHLDDLLRKHQTEDEGGTKVRLALQPLKDIHLKSNRIQELSINASGQNVRYLLISAIIVLLISWMNYVLLSTALSADRAREVGIRKVLGSAKKQLIYQFLGEAATINFLATILAVGISELSLKMISDFLLEDPLPSFLTDFSTFYGWAYKGAIIGIFLLGVISSGIYPALVLSSFKLISALQGRIQSMKGKPFRNTLVTIQFTITFILCSFMFAVLQQIHYMKNSELGFNMENVVVIQAPRVVRKGQSYTESVSTFKNELLKSTHIQSMTASYVIPGKPHSWGGDLKRLNYEGGKDLSVFYNGVDYDFLEQYGIKLLSGRGFSKAFGNDPNEAVILNETAIKKLEFKNPEEAIGQRLQMMGLGDVEKVIIGVVADFKQESLKNDPAPYVLFLYNAPGYYSLKINGKETNRAIADMQASWEFVYPKNPLKYFFLEDFYNEQYRGEYKFFTVLTTSSVLLLLIASFGLFGLLAFATKRSLKEISVRKIFGASLISIWVSIHKSLLVILFTSMVLAIPIAYFFIDSWLESYSFQVGISPLFFVVPFVVVLVVSLSVIGFYSVKVSKVNPAVFLRNE
ncbi:ABC transporter permease [Xanthovirga aplysinae]|uniref:ABC transporter permease n=1 Tax=Xanthovirga aplysinae TaxID=2529853 RepID=UPI0012BD03F8|nr:ABC transporter permease [Xanthovirga aplysinae]MTI30181.1 ABC transporter permease [Xanthovirga aplysinae]